jgi:hypothetical protein
LKNLIFITNYEFNKAPQRYRTHTGATQQVLNSGLTAGTKTILSNDSEQQLIWDVELVEQEHRMDARATGAAAPTVATA